eukprot:363973-Chlamydomonas_euryale.AAC.13
MPARCHTHLGFKLCDAARRKVRHVCPSPPAVGVLKARQQWAAVGVAPASARPTAGGFLGALGCLLRAALAAALVRCQRTPRASGCARPAV